MGMSAEGAALGSMLSMKCRTFGAHHKEAANHGLTAAAILWRPFGPRIQLTHGSRNTRPPTVSSVSGCKGKAGGLRVNRSKRSARFAENGVPDCSCTNCRITPGSVLSQFFESLSL